MDMCDCNAWFLCLLGNFIKGNTVVIRNIRNWILVDCICSIRDIFMKEVLFIVEMRKEGKMYGIIA